MSSGIESICRICLGEGAKIPIFDDFKSIDGSIPNVQNKLTVCLNEKIDDLHGYPQHLCQQCELTVNIVYNFINKYKETCKILQNSLHLVVKQEKDDYENYHDFGYPEDNIKKNLELKSTKTEVKIEFEDGAHFIEKIKSLSQLKTKGKIKSKKLIQVKKKTIKKPQISSLSKNKSNLIIESLLEGQVVWNGEDWCNTNHQKTDDKKEQADVSINLRHPYKAEKKALDSFLCESCGEKFKSRDYLKLHINIKHNHDQTATCSVCNTTLTSQYYLSRHMKRLHGTKNFICSKCGKAFAYQRDLSQHVKNVHEKGKVYKRQACKFCDRDFIDKKTLIIHERSAHTGERPAACTVCNASFFHQDYLKEHMRLHTGERPFACPVCGRGYAQRGNMKSHMRNHRISELSREVLSKIKPSWYRFMKP